MPAIAERANRTIPVVGYGSLLSGYGLLAERRGGNSRLIARDAEPLTLRNARRGLAKPSSHGSYLAMDIEPIEPAAPITASVHSDDGGIGGLLLTFDREYAPMIARREEYKPEAFARLLTLADAAGLALGQYLFEIAERTKFDLLAYRVALREILGYTSPGYIFHPLKIDDGRFAIIAIGSGYDGSGDALIPSRRRELGMDRLLTLAEALLVERPAFDRAGQIGYFAECILGGRHGIGVGDLTAGLEDGADCARELAVHLGRVAGRERERFMQATSLDSARYAERFTRPPHASLAPLFKLAGVV